MLRLDIAINWFHFFYPKNKIKIIWLHIRLCRHVTLTSISFMVSSDSLHKVEVSNCGVELRLGCGGAVKGEEFGVYSTICAVLIIIALLICP